MPITGLASYIPTTNEILQHWEALDAGLGAGNELMLPGGFERSNLADERDELETLRDGVTDAGVDKALAREQLTTLVTAMQARLVEFNQRIRADLPGNAFTRVLPEAFTVGMAEGVVREALRAMARLWTKVNAISPVPEGFAVPVVLMEGYTLALFNTDRETLRTKYVALTDAQVDLDLARERRNDKQEAIYRILKNYRAKVPTMLPADHALIASLPALTPPEGHTPEAVSVQAVWDAPAVKAKITWEASADGDVVSYQVRGVPGEDYESDDEVLIATVGPGDPREVLTDFALNAPGITAGFKVYVVLDTGREKGSVPRFVTRPG